MKKFALTLVLAAATAHNAFAEVNDGASTRSFSVSKSKCGITIPKGDFVIAKEQLKADGTTAYYMLTNEKRYINFSFYIETESKSCDSGEKCLDAVLKNKMYATATNMKRYERAGFSAAEFNIEIPTKDDRKLVQKNLLAQSYQSGCWVDIHISQVGTDVPDINNVLPILDTAKIDR